MKLSYNLTKEEYLKGWDLYYKRYKKINEYIKAIVFALISILFIQQIYLDPTYGIGWAGTIVCWLYVVYIFIFTKPVAKKRYELALDELVKDELVISGENSEGLEITTVIAEEVSTADESNVENSEQRSISHLYPYDSKDSALIEKEDILWITAKEASQVIPKRIFEDESIIAALKEKYNKK